MYSFLNNHELMKDFRPTPRKISSVSLLRMAASKYSSINTILHRKVDSCLYYVILS